VVMGSSSAKSTLSSCAGFARRAIPETPTTAHRACRSVRAAPQGARRGRPHQGALAPGVFFVFRGDALAIMLGARR
jgi:hypothetical protein